MLCPNPNGIDIREMPRRFDEAFRTILDIRRTLLFLAERSEIPLAHEDGTPLDDAERLHLEHRLSSVSADGQVIIDLCIPIRDFVTGLKCAMKSADSHTTHEADLQR